MNTSVVKVEDSTLVVYKCDNSNDTKAFTVDELEHYVDGIVGNYNLESDEEEALLSLLQGFKAVAATLEYNEMPSCSS